MPMGIPSKKGNAETKTITDNRNENIQSQRFKVI